MYHSTSSFLYVPGTRDHDTQKQKAAPDWRLHQLCCWTNRLYVDRKTPVIGHGYCPKHVLGDPPNRQKETRNLKMRRRVQANFGSGKKPWHHSDLSQQNVLKGWLGFSVGPTKSRSCVPTGPRHRQLRLTQICRRLLMISPFLHKHPSEMMV